jgi:hypothetical protein
VAFSKKEFWALAASEGCRGYWERSSSTGAGFRCLFSVALVQSVTSLARPVVSARDPSLGLGRFPKTLDVCEADVAVFVKHLRQT